MRASVLDLRYKMKEVVSALDRNEDEFAALTLAGLRYAATGLHCIVYLLIQGMIM